MIGDLLLGGVVAQVLPDSVTDVVDTTEVSTWDPLWGAVAIVAGALLAYFARLATRSWCQKLNLPANIVDLSVTLVTWAVVGLAILVALSFVGLSANWLWWMALLLLVAFIVGGRVLMESFGAGVMLQSRAPFTPGDLVRVGEHLGKVVEVNSRVVILDTVDGERLFLPNQVVLAQTIANLTARGRRMSSLLLDVAYGTDLDLAARVAEESLSEVEGVLEEPEPVAELKTFEESTVRISLRFWHEPELEAEWEAVDAASRAVYAAFDANDLQFAFPQTTLWWGETEEESGTG